MGDDTGLARTLAENTARPAWPFQAGGDQKPMYSVVFRACDRISAVNGVRRPWGLTKTALVKTCFTSLQTAIREFPHTITVLGDKLSEELTDFFRAQEVELILGSWGNDASIRQSLTTALAAGPEDWVYFCEDDYLHAPDAFTAIDDLIRNKRRYLAKTILNPREYLDPADPEHLVIFPADYPDRYLSRRRHPSTIYLADKAHWRQVHNITFTFMAHRKTIGKFASAIERCSRGANDGRLSRLMFSGVVPRRSALCLSPIPGLAAHLHEGTMSPRVDWQALVGGSGPAAR